MTSFTRRMELDVLIHVSQNRLPTRCSAMAAGKETHILLPLKLVDAEISRQYITEQDKTTKGIPEKF